MNYDRFVGRVQSLAKLASKGEAVAAIRATLTTLGERLQGREADHLAAQLPREIALLVTRDGGERFPLTEFFERIAARARIKKISKAVYQARAVLEVLKEAVSGGEIADVMAQLPPDYDRLLQAGTEGPLRIQGGPAPGAKAKRAQRPSAAPRRKVAKARKASPAAKRGARAKAKGRKRAPRTRTAVAGKRTQRRTSR